MDLDEYIWRYKKSAGEIGLATNCSSNTLGKIKRGECSAGLHIALKLVDYSKGKIKIEKLLSKKDQLKFELWKELKEEENEN